MSITTSKLPSSVQTYTEHWCPAEPQPPPLEQGVSSDPALPLLSLLAERTGLGLPEQIHLHRIMEPQNPRVVCVGRNHKDDLFVTPLAQAGTPFTSSD